MMQSKLPELHAQFLETVYAGFLAVTEDDLSEIEHLLFEVFEPGAVSLFHVSTRDNLVREALIDSKTSELAAGVREIWMRLIAGHSELDVAELKNAAEWPAFVSACKALKGLAQPYGEQTRIWPP